jgi:ABC-type transporter Mla subunit MlaD
MAREPRKASAHLNQRVTRAAEKLNDHTLLLGFGVAAVALFLAYIAFASTTGPPFQSAYRISVEVPPDRPTEFADSEQGSAPPLRVGQAVRISGQLAGLISGVEPNRETGGATVTANITKPAFRPIGKDATAFVRVHSIVYQTYLEIEPGDRDDPMEDGDTIARENVSSGVDLLEVVQLFDQEARESLRATVVNIGQGVAGRGTGLNSAFKDLEPVSTNLRKQLDAATRDEGALGELVNGAASTTDALRGFRSDDFGGTISSGGAVFDAVASRREQLGQAIELLPPFQDEFLETAPVAIPTLNELADAAGELEPAVKSLNGALPRLNRLLALGDELRTETVLTGELANPIVSATIPVVRKIFPILAALDHPDAPGGLARDAKTVVAKVSPYIDDIIVAGERLAEVTSQPFPQGTGVGAGAPSGRVIPILTCHESRNPYPDPGTAEGDSAPCP